MQVQANTKGKPRNIDGSRGDEGDKGRRNDGLWQIGSFVFTAIMLALFIVCMGGCEPFTKYKTQVADNCENVAAGINAVQEIAEVACAMDVLPAGICNTAQAGYKEIAPVLEGLCHGAGVDTELNEWEW